MDPFQHRLPPVTTKARGVDRFDEVNADIRNGVTIVIVIALADRNRSFP